ncbi:hypothetical protein PR003_g22479 [Phytophthora rubi]|uniref:Uncharacterized protein n=1 Tax=Phytophthora rubi TaxID=129364 RepID=A0A6A4D558_9STRA|nr:hypothetical protein PR002_g19397 [Phytophthora rubi]KAE9301588.1 hypothetical protein PR003_g22479 [Phytophthora rubi]
MHLEGHHVGYEAAAEECAKKNCAPISSKFVHKDAADTYGWAQLVAVKNFPFAHVNDPVIRAAIRYNEMDRATLLKRMIALVDVVDFKIVQDLAGKTFALVFDGFTDSAEHAIVIFAATEDGLLFLAFPPFTNEASMTAAEHIDFLDMVHAQYGLHVADMVAVVPDNMETNKAISRRVGVPRVGCAAHRFNLAVRERLKPHMSLIKKVSGLMRKLKTVKRIAKLKEHGCEYKPVPLHELRWSGCYRMMQRF